MTNKIGAFFKRGPRAVDMTVGDPLKRILVFMIPLVIGNIFQQLYSMVDTVIVGRALGADALSGVGSTGAVSFLILGFVSGLTHGFSVVISQRRGARDEEGMRRAFAGGIALTLVIVSALTVAAVFAAEPLLAAMNTYEDYMPYALDYITTIFGGMLLSAFYNEFSSTLRAIGDSVVPLLFLILSSLINVGLDCLFVLGLGMGVRGAAAATLAANGISAVLTLIYMWVKYPVLRLKPRHFLPDLKRYAQLSKLGVPMALQMSVVSVGMIFGQTALNAMDPVAITAYVAASKTDGLATAAINSSGAAAATFVGQNYGARKYERIRRGTKRFFVFSACMSVALGALVLALHRPLVMLFIKSSDTSPELFGYALKYLAFNAGFYVLLASLCLMRSALQGMGRGTLALAAAAAEVVMRVGIALIAIKLCDYTFVCMGNCMSWIGANLILVPSFFMTLRKYSAVSVRDISRFKMPDPSAVPMFDADGRR